MRLISLFSGIGGLESASIDPILCCELDPPCRDLIQRRMPRAALHDDVTTLRPPPADAILGGWPCQDLSVAGLRAGLDGSRSGLFFDLVRIAVDSGATSLVAENVPNLLTMEGGGVFREVLQRLTEAGFPHIAWRVLNARQFGLPHERRRVFIIASKDRQVARALHRPLPGPSVATAARGENGAAGFYWTAGIQSLCYSPGFCPTLKVGSSLSIPSPPAVHFGTTVRKLRPDECLVLQGFDPTDFEGVRPGDAYRMAGNAVAVPVGQFVVDSLIAEVNDDPFIVGFGAITESGLMEEGTPYEVEHPPPALCSNLEAVIDMTDRTELSPRAARGLLTRLERSGKPCPEALRARLGELAGSPEMLAGQIGQFHAASV
jgi:DNA (cytosine-5)-methyltransferase 1